MVKKIEKSFSLQKKRENSQKDFFFQFFFFIHSSEKGSNLSDKLPQNPIIANEKGT